MRLVSTLKSAAITSAVLSWAVACAVDATSVVVMGPAAGMVTAAPLVIVVVALAAVVVVPVVVDLPATVDEPVFELESVATAVLSV
jgi:hypothetical protein